MIGALKCNFPALIMTYRPNYQPMNQQAYKGSYTSNNKSVSLKFLMPLSGLPTEIAWAVPRNTARLYCDIQVMSNGEL